jgi:hypothetical protein
MNDVAVSEHRSNDPDPISLKPGDVVELGRRDDQQPGWIWVENENGGSGWVPKATVRAT